MISKVTDMPYASVSSFSSEKKDDTEGNKTDNPKRSYTNFPWHKEK